MTYKGDSAILLLRILSKWMCNTKNVEVEGARQVTVDETVEDKKVECLARNTTGNQHDIRMRTRALTRSSEKLLTTPETTSNRKDQVVRGRELWCGRGSYDPVGETVRETVDAGAVGVCKEEARVQVGRSGVNVSASYGRSRGQAALCDQVRVVPRLTADSYGQPCLS